MFKKAVLLAMTVLIGLTAFGCGGGDRQSAESVTDVSETRGDRNMRDRDVDQTAPQE